MKKILGTFLAMILITGVAYAHGGMEHIMGTVVSMTDSSITVKTKDGKIQTVQVAAETKYTQMDKPITMKDLKAGDQVVIHAAKKDGKLVAETVKVGMAGMKGMSGDMSGMKMDEDSKAPPQQPK
jgi:Cu/Ag efflux protein CusF